MQRRTFLQATVNAALLPSAAWADALCPQSPASTGLSGATAGALKENLLALYGTSSRILLGQHVHTDVYPLLYAFSDEHIALMGKTNKKHLITEFPVEFQSVFDAVAHGNKSIREMATSVYIPWLSPRDSTGLMMAVGRGLVMMKRAGISVHGCDTSISETSAEDQQAFNDFMRGKAPPNESANQRLIKARLDDRKRHDLIRTRTGDADYVAIMGSLHFEDHAHSLKSLIGKSQPHINLYRDETIYQEAHKTFCAFKSDFVGLIETGRLYQTGDKALPVQKSALSKPAINFT